MVPSPAATTAGFLQRNRAQADLSPHCTQTASTAVMEKQKKLHGGMSMQQITKYLLALFPE
jgi:hypothetical protein